MDKEALIQRLMETFLDELEEHVAAMNEDLLALEKGGTKAKRKQRLKTLSHTAQSLKGAARSVKQRALEGACHVLEELLAPAREGNVTLESEHLDVIFAAADAFAGAGQQLRAGEKLDEAPLASVTKRLQELSDGASPQATASPRPEPDAPEPDAPEPDDTKDAQEVPAAPTDEADAKQPKGGEAELLERRAEQLSQAVESTEAAADGLQVLACQLGGERYAIETRYILEAFPLTRVTPVPGARPTLKGVANLRGTLLPVFDLGQVLGLEQTISDLVRIVVLGRGGPELGVLVDQVDEPMVLPRETLHDAPLETAGDSLVLGMTEDTLVVLDGAELLDDGRFHARGARSPTQDPTE